MRQALWPSGRPFRPLGAPWFRTYDPASLRMVGGACLGKSGPVVDSFPPDSRCFSLSEGGSCAEAKVGEECTGSFQVRNQWDMIAIILHLFCATMSQREEGEDN